MRTQAEMLEVGRGLDEVSVGVSGVLEESEESWA